MTISKELLFFSDVSRLVLIIVDIYLPFDLPFSFLTFYLILFFFHIDLDIFERTMVFLFYEVCTRRIVSFFSFKIYVWYKSQKERMYSFTHMKFVLHNQRRVYASDKTSLSFLSRFHYQCKYTLLNEESFSHSKTRKNK